MYKVVNTFLDVTIIENKNIQSQNLLVGSVWAIYDF